MRAGLPAAMLVLFASTVTQAQDRRDYPLSLVERPMTLPKSLVSIALEGTINNALFRNDLEGTDAGGFGIAMSLSADVGLPRRMQIGSLIGFSMVPGRYGQFWATFQRELVDNKLNFRVDVGEESIFLNNFFVAGVGLPLRWKPHQKVAIVSGSSWSRGFGLPMRFSIDGGNGISSVEAVAQSNDIVALMYTPGSTIGSTSNCNTGVPSGGNPTSTPTNPLSGVSVGSCGGALQALELSLFLPVGVLFQPIPQLAVTARTGARVIMRWFSFPTTVGNPMLVETYVPFSLDVTVSLHRSVDFGTTATFRGCVGDRQCGWADVQRYDFWIVGRI